MSATDVMERARSSAYRIMRSSEGKRPVPKGLAQIGADLIGDYWLNSGLATSRNGRLTVEQDARAQAQWAAKRVEWMTNRDRHHGQQAGEYAAKTIRAMQNRSISAKKLFARCEEFSRLRKKHIDRKSSRKQVSEARVLRFEDLGIVARWITSGKQINEVGHSMGNCLANKEFAKEYKARLRQGDIELVVLDGEDGGHEVLLSISVSGSTVEEVKGPDNDRPVGCRDAILALMARQKLVADKCPDLLGLGICDELLAGRENKDNNNFTIDHRECEVGNGFLTVVWDDTTILLRSGNDLSWNGDVCTINSEDDGYLAQATARIWLRRACRNNPEFAQACADAFQNAPRVFRLDWFGSSRRQVAE